MRRSLAALVSCTIVAVAWPAAADVGPEALREPGVFVSAGVTLAGSVHPDDLGGFVLGGEASVFHFWSDDVVWLGGYADAVYDWGNEGFRHSVGPEVGFGPVGVDFGYLGQLREDLYQPGLSLRPIISLGIIGAYGRVAVLFEPTTAFGEIGVLLKYPLKVSPEVVPIGL